METLKGFKRTHKCAELLHSSFANGARQGVATRGCRLYEGYDAPP